MFREKEIGNRMEREGEREKSERIQTFRGQRINSGIPCFSYLFAVMLFLIFLL